MRPLVIIPALNPDEKLINLVESLNKMELQTIIVDDGSRQECSSIFSELKGRCHCNVCHHVANQGKGAALKTGILYASQKYPDCSGYVTADADGQHAAADILTIADLVEKNQESFVLGIRDFNKDGIPWKSLFGNKLTSLVFLLSTGKQCLDTQTGLRGIPKRFTEICLSTMGDRYEYEMNFLLEMGRERIPLIYAPIDTIYLEENKSSHFHPIKDSALIYLNIMKYSLSSVTSAATDLAFFTIFVSFVSGRGFYGILEATVMARLISGSVNFMINKNWVFQSKKNHGEEAFKYSILFCTQMMASCFLVSCLSSLPLHLAFIKMLVDTGLFFISYQIQKKYIFRTKDEGGQALNEKILYKTF